MAIIVSDICYSVVILVNRSQPEFTAPTYILCISFIAGYHLSGELMQMLVSVFSTTPKTIIEMLTSHVATYLDCMLYRAKYFIRISIPYKDKMVA